jgi:hypothetical protein
LTVEQKTKVRETVLRGSSAPRVTTVNFNISVGTVVPTTVRVVELPPVLIEYYPDWRGHLYFVYNDEIIIVDHNHHIIAAGFDVDSEPVWCMSSLNDARKSPFKKN